MTLGAPSSPWGTVLYSIFTPVFSSRNVEKRLVSGVKVGEDRVITDSVVPGSPNGSDSRALGPT